MTKSEGEFLPRGRKFWEERLHFNITRQFAIFEEYYNTCDIVERVGDQQKKRNMNIVHSDFALILS